MADQQMDPELQQFLAMEQQKAKIQEMVNELTDVCWEKCVDKVYAKLDSRQSTCISNCVGRFIDTSKYIVEKAQGGR